MSKHVRCIGVVSFKDSAAIRGLLERIARWASRRPVRIAFHPPRTPRLPRGIETPASKREFLRASDVLLSLGGDGTFISVVHMAGFSRKPVVGVNTGGLGFLTDITPRVLESSLDHIAAGEFDVVHRMTLEARIVREGETVKKLRALNDLFINRCDKPKLITVGAWYGNNHISTFQGDGVIVATPSGSTAYSLAAGGPIVEPDLELFLFTPICSHSLTERPLILSSSTPIRLTTEPDNPHAMVSADGLETVKLKGGDEILIGRGEADTKLLHLSGLSYFDLLRRKMNWGKNLKARDHDDS